MAGCRLTFCRLKVFLRFRLAKKLRGRLKIHSSSRIFLVTSSHFKFVQITSKNRSTQNSGEKGQMATKSRCFGSVFALNAFAPIFVFNASPSRTTSRLIPADDRLWGSL